jgi:hypothetical protein
LPAEIAWSYRRGRGAPAPAALAPPRRLLVSDVQPPPHLALPPLSPWRPEPPSPGLVHVSGAAATPARVLAELESASEVEVHAHGFVDLAVSDASMLVLSPEPGGRFALTAGDLRQHRLRGRPVVVLAACESAQVAPFLHEPWSLPTSLVAAGARAVIAVPTAIRDAQAGPFFAAVLERVRKGAAPAVALRDERRANASGRWVDDVVVFE